MAATELGRRKQIAWRFLLMIQWYDCQQQWQQQQQQQQYSSSNVILLAAFMAFTMNCEELLLLLLLQDSALGFEMWTRIIVMMANDNYLDVTTLWRPRALGSIGALYTSKTNGTASDNTNTNTKAEAKTAAPVAASSSTWSLLSVIESISPLLSFKSHESNLNRLMLLHWFCTTSSTKRLKNQLNGDHHWLLLSSFVLNEWKKEEEIVYLCVCERVDDNN